MYVWYVLYPDLLPDDPFFTAKQKRIVVLGATSSHLFEPLSSKLANNKKCGDPSSRSSRRHY